MGEMSATTSPRSLSRLARLALAKPEFRSRILPLLRKEASGLLPPEAKLRLELRRRAATVSDPALAERIAQALDERSARFEEGTSVDVEAWLRDRGLNEAADDWAKNTEKYKDKFKG